MSKHTPGPWEMKGSLGIEIESDEWVIAEIWPLNKSFAALEEEAIANARLIAAAPNLAGACLQLVQAYQNGKQNGGSISWDDLDDAFSHAKTALDKAGIEYEMDEENEQETTH